MRPYPLTIVYILYGKTSPIEHCMLILKWPLFFFLKTFWNFFLSPAKWRYDYHTYFIVYFIDYSMQLKTFFLWDILFVIYTIYAKKSVWITQKLINGFKCIKFYIICDFFCNKTRSFTLKCAVVVEIFKCNFFKTWFLDTKIYISPIIFDRI